MTPIHQIRRHTGRGKLPCVICNEPVKLEAAKTDEDGHAVHDECYLDKIATKTPITPKSR